MVRKVQVMVRKVQVPGGEPAAPPDTEQPVAVAQEQASAAPGEPTDDESYREQARGLRAKDVDPTRLKRAVLTLDGWVCPVAAPAPAVKQ